MTDSDPIAAVEAMPWSGRAAAALGPPVLEIAAALDADSLEYARLRARLQGCGALSKGWDARVDQLRPRRERPSVERWAEGLRRSEEGKPAPSPLNAGLILRNWPPLATLRLNALTLEAELDGAPWRDGDTFRWQERIERTWDVSFSKDVLDSAVEAVAEERAYHPMRERLDRIAWDGVRRIPDVAREILDCHDPLGPRMIECFLVGTVARLYRPGEKMDDMLTLFSAEQGRKKTTFFELIAYDYCYIGPFDPANKDHVMYAATSLLNVLDECDELTGRMEWPAIKRFTSMRFDTFRPPYGRRPRRFARGFANVATTNRSDFLRDETGSRRFHVLAVGPADPDARMRKLESWRDQLWAEARELWLDGTANGCAKPRDHLWWLTPAEEAARADGARRYEDRGVIDDRVEDHVGEKVKLYGAGVELRMADILIDALGVERERVAKEKGLERHAGAVLRRLGWEAIERTTPDGRRGRVWVRREATL